MQVKTRQIYVSSKTDRFIRVERFKEKAEVPRDSKVEIVEVTYNDGKFIKVKGTDRIIFVDSIRRHYIPIQL